MLRATNQKVAVVIATDGESSDGDIAAAMAPLSRMPVVCVIRLCTDQDSICEVVAMCKAQRSQKDEAQMAIGVPDALDGARSAAAQLAHTADEALQFLL